MLFLLVGCVSCERAPTSAGRSLADDVEFIGAEPHLARADDGTVVLSWLEPDDDAVALRFATRRDGEWGLPQTVSHGDRWFVNWADFPSVSPIRGDLWAAHWLVKRPGGTYAYDVAIALSTDGGQHWDSPITPHTDGTRTEHGFVTLFPWQDRVGALWLDGRQMAEEHAGTDTHGGGMTLRSAQLNASGDIDAGHLVDELVCDCCQTDVAIAADGPVAVYRNRTSAEIRDIYVARHVATDGWQPGIPVANDDWEISGCPVNGPAIVADGRNVAVAWFTAANGEPRVRAARSEDGGARFTSAIDVDTDSPIGRVDIDMLDTESIVVSYLAKSADGGGEVVAQAIAGDGTLGIRRVVARTATSRSAGFPQMIRQGDELVFAWTDTPDERSRVRTATIAVDAFR